MKRDQRARFHSSYLPIFIFAATAVGVSSLEGRNAFGATRTVQYSGMGVNDPLMPEISNWSFMTFCNLSVANLSSSTQRIKKVDLINYVYSASPTTVYSLSNGLAMAIVGFVSWRGGTSRTACVGETVSANLAPGEVCYIRYPMQTLSWSGKIGSCMGKITVEDVDAASPGSVIASGALYMNQEAMVLGGQLSGAFYSSQTHVQAEDFGTSTSLQPVPTLVTGYTFKHAQNMNVFCGAACYSSSSDRSSSWTQTDCDQHCGLGMYGTDTGNNGASHGSGTMDPYPAAGGSGDNGWFHHISGWTMKTPKTAFKSEVTTIDGQSDINEKAEEGSTTNQRIEKLDRMQYHSVANGHFAGGMVYEMQIGAYNAICSAHNQYAKDGGLEFKHVDGVDSHAVYSSNSREYPGAPPERLVCAHRHMKNDLFMRVGSTSPIVVNGGMPF